MSKASILRQLSDDDLEAVQHLIRRDAMPDDKIAEVAESKIGNRKSKIHPMVIARYRQSAEYKRWLTAWENRDAELRKAIETQKQRFELISTLVSAEGGSASGGKTGLETVSKSIQARLLALAAEADDKTLKEAAGGKGWVAEALKLAQADVRDSYRRKIEELKTELERIMNAPKGKPVKTEDLVATVDHVMGIKRK